MANKNIPPTAGSSTKTNIIHKASQINFEQIFTEEWAKHKDIGKEGIGDEKIFKATSELLHEFRVDMRNWLPEDYIAYIIFTQKMISNKSEELLHDDFAFAQQEACDKLFSKIEFYLAKFRYSVKEKGQMVSRLDKNKIAAKTIEQYKEYLKVIVTASNQRSNYFRNKYDTAVYGNDRTNVTSYGGALAEAGRISSNAKNLLAEIIRS